MYNKFRKYLYVCIDNKSIVRDLHLLRVFNPISPSPCNPYKHTLGKTFLKAETSTPLLNRRSQQANMRPTECFFKFKLFLKLCNFSSIFSSERQLVVITIDQLCNDGLDKVIAVKHTYLVCLLDVSSASDLSNGIDSPHSFMPTVIPPQREILPGSYLKKNP